MSEDRSNYQEPESALRKPLAETCGNGIVGT